MIVLILQILALVLFALATVPVPSRFNLTAAGLFCWLLSTLFVHGVLR